VQKKKRKEVGNNRGNHLFSNLAFFLALVECKHWIANVALVLISFYSLWIFETGSSGDKVPAMRGMIVTLITGLCDRGETPP